MAIKISGTDIIDNSRNIVNLPKISTTANSSYGTAGQVLTSGGPAGNAYWKSIPGGATQDIFTSSGTWTKPSTASFVVVRVWGGGQGGQGGQSNPAPTLARGGAGGAGGSFQEKLFLAGDLAPSYPVVIGAGGAGAPAGPGAAASQPGIGGSGGSSNFGGIITAYGGSAAAQSRLLTVPPGSPANSFSTWTFPICAGGAGAYYGSPGDLEDAGTTAFAGAGGGSGSIRSSSSTGGVGGRIDYVGIYTGGGGTGGTAPGVPGSNGVNIGDGGGGGSGGTPTGGTGGRGGNGAVGGGGGGGGGGTLTGNASGAGGNGGGGRVEVITW